MGILSLVVSLLSVLAMVLLLFLCPKIKLGKFEVSTFFLPPLAGLIVLLSFGALSPSSYFAGLVAAGGMNPLEILLLFFSMTFLSVSLDELGFFSYLASKMVQRAKGSQTSLFFLLYALCAILTMFTSNDVVILTFTPFLIFYAKSAHIDPVPYLVCEFVAANSWSMMFIFGNPTNVYLASSAGIDFLGYLRYMWLPTLCAGLVSLGLLYGLFHKKLKQEMRVEVSAAYISQKGPVIVNLALLGAAIVLMAISNYVDLPMYLSSAVCAGALLLFDLGRLLVKKKKPVELLCSLKRLPYDLFPFLLSMFGIVMALEQNGITANLASFLQSLPSVWGYGLSGFLASNLLNNIPMSVLYAGLLPSGDMGALFASIIASNLGAFLSPLGALAGIMFLGLVKKEGVEFSFLSFSKYGSLIALPSLLAALGGLCLLLL